MQQNSRNILSHAWDVSAIVPRAHFSLELSFTKAPLLLNGHLVPLPAQTGLFYSALMTYSRILFI